MSDVKLSVIVVTYNHEKTIKHAIDSILMQKTNYSYEVLIGEDCSSDNTRNVLHQMKELLPANFHLFFREENMGEAANNADLCARSQGDYIIFLEGDDFWTDENKLQEQIHYLEHHPSVIAIAHRVQIVDFEGNPRSDYIYPESKKRKYSLKEFRRAILAGHTSTLMFRNIYRDQQFPMLQLPFPYPGDQQKNFLLALWGEVHCWPKKMSAYRFAPECGHSYVGQKRDLNDLLRSEIAATAEMLNYTKTIGENSPQKNAVKYMEQAYIRRVFKAMQLSRSTAITWNDLAVALKKCHYKLPALCFVILDCIGEKIKSLGGKLF